ncbi:MAG: ankyrin repeat domain-containing protein [Spirochaetota bacterium]
MKPRRRALVALFIILACILAVPPLWSQGRTRTPLHWAAYNGHADIVRSLIDNGADVEATDILGRTPLHVAVDHPEVVEVLLEHGAAVDARDSLSNTPLHRALGSPETVDILISAGADVEARNTGGSTPLEMATRRGNARKNLTVVERLVAAGAGGD